MGGVGWQRLCLKGRGRGFRRACPGWRSAAIAAGRCNAGKVDLGVIQPRCGTSRRREVLGRLAGRSRHECGGSGATGQRRAALRSGTEARAGRHGEEEGAAKWVRRVSERGDTRG